MRPPSIKSASLSWLLTGLNVANACMFDEPGLIKNLLFFLGGTLFVIAVEETLHLLVDRG